MWSKECYQNSLIQPMMHEAQEESGDNPGCILGDSKLCVQPSRREQRVVETWLLGQELDSPDYVVADEWRQGWL